PGKAVGGRARITWAIEEPGCDQVVGKRLKQPEQIIKVAAQARGGLYELERAACVGGNLGGKTVVVIVGKHVEAQTDLLQIADAFGTTRPSFGLSQHGQ